MLVEDRLDALLSSTLAGAQRPVNITGDDGLEPLLAAAGSLRPLRDAAPSATFAHTLELRLLAHAATLARDGAVALSTQETLSAIERATDAIPVEMHASPTNHQPASMSHRERTVRRPRFIWPAVAAAVLLLALGTLTAAAAAGPGSLLYGLHRLEQGITVALSGSPAARMRLHLQYAAGALASADSAAHSGDSATFNDALAPLQSELVAAASELPNVPPGADHDALASELSSLRTHVIADLHGDLQFVNWPQRLAATSTLAVLGDTVPHVTSALAIRVHASVPHTWRVVVTGTGFASDAQLLVNGQPAGAVISVSSTSLVATYTASDDQPPSAIGVANSDDTAAQTTDVPLVPSDNSATPGPAGTPGGDHSGDHGGTDKGGHSGDHGTPTPASPTPTSTPPAGG